MVTDREEALFLVPYEYLRRSARIHIWTGDLQDEEAALCGHLDGHHYHLVVDIHGNHHRICRRCLHTARQHLNEGELYRSR